MSHAKGDRIEAVGLGRKIWSGREYWVEGPHMQGHNSAGCVTAGAPKQTGSYEHLHLKVTSGLSE